MIKMALERSYNIPLRKAFMRTPKYRRAKKAVTELRLFLQKHMKSDNIKIGKVLNKKLWERGIRNPPHHIKINALKEDDGTVRVELFGVPIELKKEEKEKGKEGKKEKETVEKKVKEEKSPKVEKKQEVIAEKKTPEEKKDKEESSKEIKSPQEKK